MRQNILTLFCFLTCAFFIDSLCIVITGFFLTHLALCCAISFFFFSRSWSPFIGSFVALGLESFIAFDFFGLTYLYSIPLFLCIGFLKYYLSSSLLAAHLSLLILLIAHTIFISQFGLISSPLGLYTLLQIGGNLSLLYFSLKWLATAKRGNRF